MDFIDIHTHILYGVDDGADKIEAAVEMLKNAVASDVSAVVLTPHCNHPAVDRDNYLSDDLKERFQTLKRAAADIPITLYLGAEAHAIENLPELLDMEVIPTLAGSRYLLTEFNETANKEYCDKMLGEIISRGYVPIIAHPERYLAVCENPKIVADWLDMGCHTQLTSGSITGAFGKTAKKTADFLLKNDLVCCVASDAHGTKTRTNLLTDVYSYLSLYYGKQYAAVIMHDNPQRICADDSF